MKIILAGSPKIAIATFVKVIENFDVVAIITQPNKKQGRGMKWRETPVSTLANKYDIKIFKPQKINDLYEQLNLIDFDLLLTFAYGQFIPVKILNLGKYPPLNIHGSLLPKYRGAAPIHHALLNGDLEIGITLIEMTKKMDAGKMYFQAKQSINEFTNFDMCLEIISKLASDNIVTWIKKIKLENVNPKKQSSNFTIAPKINKHFGLIDANLSIKEATRKIRALTSFPGAYTFINGKRYKLFNYVFENKKGFLTINLKDGKIFISDFQQEDKKRKQLS